jgi:hypothetical protein
MLGFLAWRSYSSLLVSVTQAGNCFDYEESIHWVSSFHLRNVTSNFSGGFPPWTCQGVVAGVEIGAGLIERCRFASNSGKAQVASVLAQGEVDIRDCMFEHHHVSFEGFPGRIVQINDGTIERCIFRENHDASGGTPIVSAGVGALSMTECQFIDNHNDVGVHALVRLSGSTTTMTDCLFARNSLGAISTWMSDLHVENVTIVDKYGPGTAIDDAHPPNLRQAAGSLAPYRWAAE